MQLIRMHPQQLSLLSSKLIKQMPPYPTFYKEQHVIDRSLARKRLYFNFDWLGFPAPPNRLPYPYLPSRKRGGEGDCARANDLAMITLNLIIILCVGLRTHLEFSPSGRGMARVWVCFFQRAIVCVGLFGCLTQVVKRKPRAEHSITLRMSWINFILFSFVKQVVLFTYFF